LTRKSQLWSEIVADQDQKQSDIDPASEAPEAVTDAHRSPMGQSEARTSAEAEGSVDASEERAANEAGAQSAEDGDEPDQYALLQDELAQMKDIALRAQADAHNVKRRAEMDVEKARKFALESFARDLLPVVDNLERALEAASSSAAEVKPIAEGVELTLKSLMDVLKRFNIEPVDPQGEPFDPQLHQAMSMVENPEVEPNTVIAVMQKGYTLNSRLVRPAMVMVSKAAQ
jgi:molecular chaperone GrpE